MIGVIDAELVEANDRWRPDEVEQLFADFRDVALGIDAETELAVSRGDSLRLQCRGERVLRIAVVLRLMARLENRAGVRVAFSVSDVPTFDPRPLGLRSGDAFLATRRAIVAERPGRASLTYAPVMGREEGWVAAVALLDVLVECLTDRQTDVLVYRLLHPGKDQQHLATHYRISQQAASKHLIAASAAEVAAVLTTFEQAHR